MRCKNCGADNDNNRYICENCGSPLYDEADLQEEKADNSTITFNAVSDDTDDDISEYDTDKASKGSSDNKSIIVIAVLAVVLIAIIISVVAIAHSRAQKPDETSTSDTTVSVSDSTSEYTTESTTKETTTEESTTKQTTTTTTAPRTYSIKLISQGGGTVDGSGTYTDGENVTISATPDENYEFDGWYSGGQKISSSMTYSFTASKNISISAVFNEIVIQEEDIENLEGDWD